jgi:hypothetical protein
MGFFDRLGNVGKGWVSSKTRQARDADLLGAAEQKLAQAKDALAKVGQEDPALDDAEDRLRTATAAEVADPKPSGVAQAPDAAPLPPGERPLAPEKDDDGNIIKRL